MWFSENGERLSKKKKKKADTDNSMLIAGGKGEVEEGKGGINAGGQGLDFGW